MNIEENIMDIRRILHYIAGSFLWALGAGAELAARVLTLWFVWPIVAAKFSLPGLNLVESGAIVIILSVLSLIARAPLSGPWSAPPKRNPFVP